MIPSPTEAPATLAPPQPPPAFRPPAPLSRSEWLWLLGILVLVLGARLPFRMHSLDEWDSANFVMSIVKFNVNSHQPHPPGQFVYVMLVQGLNWLVRNEIRTLSLASILGSTLALAPYYLLLRAAFQRPIALTAVALTATTFGFWITSLRPVSDPVVCLLVFGTVCALLYGLASGRWFYLGMGLCALTLGAKQTTVYFLLVFTVSVNLLVLLRQGWKRPLIGSGIFAAGIAAWLLPTVINCGSLGAYLAGCRQMQQENYDYESLIFHLNRYRANAQSWQNMVQPWGTPALATVMLALAAVGLLLAWRHGLRAALFSLFGLTTILYVFWFLNTFNKYYVYTVPIYCAWAAVSLHHLCAWAGPRWQRPLLGAGVLGLMIWSATLTAPILPLIPKFMATPLQALDAAKKDALDSGHAGIPVILTNKNAAARLLTYFAAKHQITLTDTSTNLAGALRVVQSTERPIYLLTESNGWTRDKGIVMLGVFTWNPLLVFPLQARPEFESIGLYKMDGQPPLEYKLEDQSLSPCPLGSGFFGDGWSTDKADLILPVDDAPADFVELEGIVPEDLHFTFPYHIAYRFGDAGKLGDLVVEKAGPFRLVLPVEKSPGARDVDLCLLPAQSVNPSRQNPPLGPDNRTMAMRITHVLCLSPERPMFTDFGHGWYSLESDGPNSWRWQGDDAVIEISAERNGTLAIDGDFLSISPDNTIEFVLDGKAAAVATVPVTIGAWQPKTLRIPLAAGAHTLNLHSHLPGRQPPGDGRTLSVGARNLHLQLLP